MQRIFSLLMVLVSLNAMTQTYHELGTNDGLQASQKYQFLPTTFTGSTVQLMFTNADLLAAGINKNDNIVGVQWYVETDGTASTTTFDLFMMDDYKYDTLPSNKTFADIHYNTIGESLADTGQYTGWHTAMFDESFTWDGTDNLVLRTCRTSSSQAGDDEIAFHNTDEIEMVINYFSSCATNTATYSNNFKPQIRFIVDNTIPDNIVELGENQIYTLSEPNQLFPNTFNGSTVQLLYTSSSLSNAGMNANDLITGIEWFVSKDGTPNPLVFDLYMSDEYTEDTLPSNKTFADVQYTTVGTSIEDIGLKDGWHSADFDTPFEWDGISNLVFQACRTSEPEEIEVRDETAYYNTPNVEMVTNYFAACTTGKATYSQKTKPYLRFKTSSVTGIEKVITPETPIANNPVVDVLLLNTTITEYEIISVNGAVLSSENNSTKSIDVSQLQKGLYFLKTDNTAYPFVKE